jgi:hypothetical protein
VGQRVWAYAVAIGAAAITSAAAADLPVEPPLRPLFSPKPIAQWETEFGGRYFFSTGRTRINLFGITGVDDNLLLSRLTWSNLQGHSGEVFGRVEHLSGFFIKGFVGGGAITGGNLQDEDFPPLTVPYSSTNSEQHDGRLAYATIDAGWGWRSKEYKFGFFGGYHYYHERVNAFGCVQTALNPVICVPSFPSSVLGITQETNWSALRLGFNSEWRFARGWIASADVAWIPYAWLVATDTHWLRPFSNPEKGTSFSNWQIEALVRYQFANGVSVGAGGRYWRIGSAFAQEDFTGFGGTLQSLEVVTERWGGFLQASYQFGALPLLRY